VGVEVSCAIMGYPRKRRPYQPHITLGRCREGRKPPAARALAYGIPVYCFPGPTFIADSFVLMESDLGGKTPAYRLVAQFGAAESRT
jgi:2'-5' RNA ligase